MQKVRPYNVFVSGPAVAVQFCVRGYHAEYIAGMNKEPRWIVTGPCNGSCEGKKRLVEIPADVLAKIREEKALRKRIK